MVGLEGGGHPITLQVTMSARIPVEASLTKTLVSVALRRHFLGHEGRRDGICKL